MHRYLVLKRRKTPATRHTTIVSDWLQPYFWSVFWLVKYLPLHLLRMLNKCVKIILRPKVCDIREKLVALNLGMKIWMQMSSSSQIAHQIEGRNGGSVGRLCNVKIATMRCFIKWLTWCFNRLHNYFTRFTRKWLKRSAAATSTAAIFLLSSSA